MERVTGIGGIFFKARDADALKDWYREHLGMEPSADGAADGGVAFQWREADTPERQGFTVWAPFRDDTQYFAPSEAPFMINYRVRDLDRMLDQLRAAGVAVDERIDEHANGRFAWAMDPEGNRFELWEPKAAPKNKS